MTKDIMMGELCYLEKWTTIYHYFPGTQMGHGNTGNQEEPCIVVGFSSKHKEYFVVHLNQVGWVFRVYEYGI